MKPLIEPPLTNSRDGGAVRPAPVTTAVDPAALATRPAKPGRLTPMAWNAVLSALEDEHDMAAFTATMIARFGPNEALLAKKASIEKQIEDLAAILRRYDEVVPDIAARAERIGVVPADVAAAHQALSAAEAAGALLYDEVLLRPVEIFPDIAGLFQRRIASARDTPTVERASGCVKSAARCQSLGAGVAMRERE